MRAENIAVGRVVVLDSVERAASPKDDETLARSIRDGGIQQPLVVVEDGGRILLVDGLRRLRIAKNQGLARVPVVFDAIPKGQEPEPYIRKIRFVLDEHRQDLLPTQKGELIQTLQRMFGLKLKQVAMYLGIDNDSVTNWLAVLDYVQPVKDALDAGRLSMQAARIFGGMTEEGQTHLWAKHGSELCAPGAGVRSKAIRAKYPPARFASFYANPAKETGRNKPKSGKPKAVPRLDDAQKLKMLNSYEVKETELAEGQREQTQLKREINAAIPIVAALIRQKELWALVPKEMREELERFGEIYC